MGSSATEWRWLRRYDDVFATRPRILDACDRAATSRPSRWRPSFRSYSDMGLHLNYELRVPASTSSIEVTQMLGALREFAASQPVDVVSPVVDLSAKSPVADGAMHWLRFSAE